MRTRLLSIALVALAPAAGGQSPFDLSRLLPGELGFELRVGGRPVGTLTATLTRSAGEWTYIERTVIPGRTEQTTEIRWSSAAEMLSVHQTGTTPAGATKIDVTYGDGRARGSATTPTQQGQLRTIAIDTTFARFAIDDNALQPLIAALPFAAGGSTTIQVFSSGQATTTGMTLTVLGGERVSVPLGEFDTWKVEARGSTTVFFSVAKTAPHRLLKLAVENSPLEMVRVR